MSGDESIAPWVDVPAPEGFGPVTLRDPFEAFVGPFFERTGEDGSRTHAFLVDERHARADGSLHEGMLMTFADAFLGSMAWQGSGGRICVTLSMQTSYQDEARLGDLVICRAKLDHKTRSILFVSGQFMVGDRLIMTATSLWKVVGEK
ncbi:MAG: PaaI family thioesterase [Parvibaculaceae bacterium]|nr:PaaI family thioesterase [Parvibaculaceae bacterium]